MLRQDALRAGLPSEQIHDLAPLPPGDQRGTVLNLVALALLITSNTGAALAIVRMPDLTAGGREAAVASIATLAGLGTTVILKSLHALPGPFLGETALFALLIFTVALTAGGLIRLRGPGGTTLAFVFFVVLANPGSGLASAPHLLPTPWKQRGPLMPPGATGHALREILYFGAAKVLVPALVLLAWAALGVSFNALTDRRTVAVAGHATTGHHPSHDRPQLVAIRDRSDVDRSKPTSALNHNPGEVPDAASRRSHVVE